MRAQLDFGPAVVGAVKDDFALVIVWHKVPYRIVINFNWNFRKETAMFLKCVERLASMLAIGSCMEGRSSGIKSSSCIKGAMSVPLVAGR